MTFQLHSTSWCIIYFSRLFYSTETNNIVLMFGDNIHNIYKYVTHKYVSRSSCLLLTRLSFCVNLYLLPSSSSLRQINMTSMLFKRYSVAMTSTLSCKISSTNLECRDYRIRLAIYKVTKLLCLILYSWIWINRD